MPMPAFAPTYSCSVAGQKADAVSLAKLKPANPGAPVGLQSDALQVINVVPGLVQVEVHMDVLGRGIAEMITDTHAQ